MKSSNMLLIVQTLTSSLEIPAANREGFLCLFFTRKSFFWSCTHLVLAIPPTEGLRRVTNLPANHHATGGHSWFLKCDTRGQHKSCAKAKQKAVVPAHRRAPKGNCFSYQKALLEADRQEAIGTASSHVVCSTCEAGAAWNALQQETNHLLYHLLHLTFTCMIQHCP